MFKLIELQKEGCATVSGAKNDFKIIVKPHYQLQDVSLLVYIIYIKMLLELISEQLIPNRSATFLILRSLKNSPVACYIQITILPILMLHVFAILST